jgi:hypothetical protein
MTKGGRLPRYEYFCSATARKRRRQYIVATRAIAEDQKMCACTMLYLRNMRAEFYKQKKTF